MNDGIIITNISSGAGAPRELSVHAYKVASTNAKRLELAILDHNKKTMGQVVLHPEAINQLFLELARLITM